MFALFAAVAAADPVSVLVAPGRERAEWFDEKYAALDLIAYYIQNDPTFVVDWNSFNSTVGLKVQFEIEPSTESVAAPGDCRPPYYCPKFPCLFVDLVYTPVDGKPSTLQAHPHCGSVLGRQSYTRYLLPDGPPPPPPPTSVPAPGYAEFWPRSDTTALGWTHIDNRETLTAAIRPVGRETIDERYVACGGKVLDTNMVQVDALEGYAESQLNRLCRLCVNRNCTSCTPNTCNEFAPCCTHKNETFQTANRNPVQVDKQTLLAQLGQPHPYRVITNVLQDRPDITPSPDHLSRPEMQLANALYAPLRTNNILSKNIGPIEAEGNARMYVTHTGGTSGTSDTDGTTTVVFLDTPRTLDTPGVKIMTATADNVYDNAWPIQDTLNLFAQGMRQIPNDIGQTTDSTPCQRSGMFYTSSSSVHHGNSARVPYAFPRPVSEKCVPEPPPSDFSGPSFSWDTWAAIVGDFDAAGIESCLHEPCKAVLLREDCVKNLLESPKIMDAYKTIIHACARVQTAYSIHSIRKVQPKNCRSGSAYLPNNHGAASCSYTGGCNFGHINSKLRLSALNGPFLLPYMDPQTPGYSDGTNAISVNAAQCQAFTTPYASWTSLFIRDDLRPGFTGGVRFDPDDVANAQTILRLPASTVSPTKCYNCATPTCPATTKCSCGTIQDPVPTDDRNESTIDKWVCSSTKDIIIEVDYSSAKSSDHDPCFAIAGPPVAFYSNTNDVPRIVTTVNCTRYHHGCGTAKYSTAPKDFKTDITCNMPTPTLDYSMLVLVPLVTDKKFGYSLECTDHTTPYCLAQYGTLPVCASLMCHYDDDCKFYKNNYGAEFACVDKMCRFMHGLPPSPEPQGSENYRPEAWRVTRAQAKLVFGRARGFSPQTDLDPYDSSVIPCNSRTSPGTLGYEFTGSGGKPSDSLENCVYAPVPYNGEPQSGINAEFDRVAKECSVFCSTSKTAAPTLASVTFGMVGATYTYQGGTKVYQHCSTPYDRSTTNSLFCGYMNLTPEPYPILQSAFVCAALTSQEVPLLDFNAVPQRLITVPADDTVPILKEACDCNNAHPVYDCTDTAVGQKSCAWSWDLPPNGAPSYGLYLGSTTGATRLANRNNVNGENTAKIYYTDVEAPTGETLAELHKSDTATKHTVLGTCLKFPFGHTHEALSAVPFDTASVSQQFYAYCARYENEFAWCERDKKSYSDREKWCTETKDVDDLVVGYVWPYNRTSPCHNSVCLFVNGDPDFRTLESVAQMAKGPATILIAPVSFRVLRGFKVDAVCTSISTGNPTPCTSRSFSISDSDYGLLLNPTMATVAVLRDLHIRAIAYHTGVDAPACAVPIPATDGVTNGVYCGVPADLAAGIPHGTVLTTPVTFAASVDVVCNTGACAGPSLVVNAGLITDYDIVAPHGVSVTGSSISVGGTLHTSTLLVKSGSGHVDIGNLSTSGLYGMAVADFSGNVTIKSNATPCSILYLQKSPATRVTWDVGVCTTLPVSELTSTFGDAEERRLMRRPANHYASLAIAAIVLALSVIVVAAVTAAALIKGDAVAAYFSNEHKGTIEAAKSVAATKSAA